MFRESGGRTENGTSLELMGKDEGGKEKDRKHHAGV